MLLDSARCGRKGSFSVQKCIPLLVTLDLHEHPELSSCVMESAEFFTGHSQRVTYLVPAMYVRKSSELGDTLRRVRALGHSIGCHGLNHTPDEDLSVISPSREYTLLKEATEILQDCGGPLG